MKSKNTLLYTGLAGLLYFGVIRGVQAVKVGFEDMYIGGIDWSQGIISVIVRIFIKNPLLVGITLYSIVADIYVDGIKCATINNTYQCKISGGKTHIIPIPVNVETSTTVGTLLNSIKSGNGQDMQVRLVGRIGVGTKKQIEIPIDKTIKVSEL